MQKTSKENKRSNVHYIKIFLGGFSVIFAVLLAFAIFSKKPKITDEHSHLILNEFTRVLFFASENKAMEIFNGLKGDNGKAQDSIKKSKEIEEVFFNSYNAYNKWREGGEEKYPLNDDLEKKIKGEMDWVNSKDSGSDNINKLKRDILMFLSTHYDFNDFFSKIKENNKDITDYFLYVVTGIDSFKPEGKDDSEEILKKN